MCSEHYPVQSHEDADISTKCSFIDLKGTSRLNFTGGNGVHSNSQFFFSFRKCLLLIALIDQSGLRISQSHVVNLFNNRLYLIVFFVGYIPPFSQLIEVSCLYTTL